jgi:hypothetical protein
MNITFVLFLKSSMAYLLEFIETVENDFSNNAIFNKQDDRILNLPFSRIDIINLYNTREKRRFL